MLQSRDDIRKDHAVDAFTDAILQRDQPRTAELFFNLVRRDGRSMGDALSVVDIMFKVTGITTAGFPFTGCTVMFAV